MTEKKNQHYIPKFYLRNFSYLSNEKQIGLYNISNEKFIQQSKLKTQGSKNFFYGKDGLIEDNLSILEGSFAERIREILSTQNLPKKYSDNHFDLLSFAAVTDLRNPIQIEGTLNSFLEIKKRLLELDENAETEKIFPMLSHEQSVELSFSMLSEVVLNMLDLEVKILKNETSTPFITSDFPVVKYNQFLEQKKWPHSKTGYATVGLQIFVPLNHKLTLIFYDSAIYKIGDRKQKIVTIKDIKSINQINILQFVNCYETLYFDEKVSENYIRQLHELSKKYKRANQSKSKLSYIINEGENSEEVLAGKENLIILNSSDCETNLSLNEFKIHSNGKAWKLNSTMAQSRKHSEKLIENKNSH